jgi:hypothetical protein
MPAMVRFQGILVVIALLAAPLALMVRGIVCDPSECKCMTVCAHMSMSQSQPNCGMATHAPMCGTHQGHHALDYGFISPFAPAVPIPQTHLAGLAASHEFVSAFSQSSVNGFLASPFEPPRG